MTAAEDARMARLEFESLDDATHWLQLRGAAWAVVYVDGTPYLLGRDGSAEVQSEAA